MHVTYRHSSRRRLLFHVLVLLVLCGATISRSQAVDTPAPAGADSADKDYSSELPRIAPLEPAAAPASFRMLEEFQIEQVAAEPLVTDPVAMDIDEHGRLFVIEMNDYSEHPQGHLGRVRVLTDTDGDGRYDQADIFLEGLSWPTAIICYDGGVFIGAPPEIYYARDLNGDNRADYQEHVFTGFNRNNVQGMMNSFRWGLDNKIHGATSTNGGDVRLLSTPQRVYRDTAEAPAGDVVGDNSESTIPLRGRDFAFDPRTLQLEATSGGAQHGMTFDDWGRKYVCSNSDHIQQVLFEDRYIARNPYLAAPGARRSIASDGPQAEVYRISPVEPWRVVRTRLRASGIVPGIVEGGGRAAGYFTGATGTTIYRGSAWPQAYRGNAFVGDVGSNIVHRKVLETGEILHVAHRADEGVEFVGSTDIWFRPAQFYNGPDGNLYILDVYREVIEHPHSIPPVIKQHLDLDSGRDRGRIYRVVHPQGAKAPPLAGGLQTPQLVRLLGTNNGWHHDTASRMLYQQQDPAAVEPLTKLAMDAADPLTRLRAMYALAGLDALSPAVLTARLQDEHPRVREHAIRLVEGLPEHRADMLPLLAKLTGEEDAQVRYQLAFTLGEFENTPERNALLAELAVADAGSSWMRLAIRSSLAAGAADVLARLVSEPASLQQDGVAVLAGELAEQIGQVGDPAAVAQVLKSISALTSAGGPAAQGALARQMVESLSRGLARGGQSLSGLLSADSAEAMDLLEGLIQDALRTAQDEQASEQQRAAAVSTLAFAPWEQVSPVLPRLLDNRQPQGVQLAAISALAESRRAEVAEILLEVWPGLSPRVRADATEVLFSRPEWITALLMALVSEEIAVTDIDLTRLRTLEKHTDQQVREQAAQLLAKHQTGRRTDVVAAYQEALSLEGDADRGRVIFRKVCAACHRAEGFGQEIGPNLATVKNRGAEAILLNVLDPNLEVNPQFVNYILVTDDGRSMTGMLAAETATSVTLTRAEGASDTVLRVNLDQLQSTGLSIMPEGLEKDINPQGMADLIHYLLTVE